MHLPVAKTGLIGLSALIALVAAVAVFLYSSGGSAEAATYAPATTAQYCNALSGSFPDSKPSTVPFLFGTPGCTDSGSPAAGGNPDYTVELIVGGTDSNFGSSVVTSVPGTTAAGAGDGGIAGGLRSDVTLGLLNGPCATPLVAEFVLYDSSTAGSVAVAAEGTTNRWSSIVTDANLDEIADSTSAFVGTNLDIYKSMLTTNGGTEVVPLARYTGATVIPAAGDWQLLSFFQFAAGGLDAFANDPADAPDILGRVSHAPADGTMSLSVLNDPTALKISVSPIHDFCSPLLVRTMLKGTTSTANVRYTAPGAGTYGVSQVSYGQRDADGDGLENARDTCPFTVDTGTDTDLDGIDDACDLNAVDPDGAGPFPANLATGGDVDRDGFANRQDNCPQYPNGGTEGSVVGDLDQLDSEAGVTYLSSAPDGGPQTDSIGDVCDPASLTAFGQGSVVSSYNMVPKCFGGGDGDGDGYCAAQDPDDAAILVTGFTLNKGMDWEYSVANGQGDGVGGNYETYFGTDPNDACGPGAWSYDLIQNNTINIFDVLALKTPFGSAVTDNTTKKFDLIPNKTINIFDVLALKAPFGTSCTP